MACRGQDKLGDVVGAHAEQFTKIMPADPTALRSAVFDLEDTVGRVQRGREALNEIIDAIDAAAAADETSIKRLEVTAAQPSANSARSASCGTLCAAPILEISTCIDADDVEPGSFRQRPGWSPAAR